MTQPNAEGDVLSDTEIRVTVMHLIIAGHETTTNLLGNLLEHLLSTPDDLARVRTDPTMIAVAVEESLRRDPPVLIQPLTCVHAIEKPGAIVEEDTRVVLSLAAANRDETAYPNPDEFVLDRPNPAPHTSFGGGAHFCPGAPLARLEGRVSLEVFLDLVADAALPADYHSEKVPVFWANGPEHLPVSLRGARSSS